MATIEREAPPAALSPMMQSIARNYLAARGRAGEAILDSARYLAEARAAAKYGEWGIFLEATGTQEDTATRMIAIASRADADRQYALAVQDGRLAFTAAFELLSAPTETQRNALESTAPTPATVIRKAKQDEKLRTSAEFARAPAEPIETDDDQAMIAAIRAQAAALGLGVIWEDDTVILHWPDENIDQLLGMGYQDALYWLAGEGTQHAAQRAATAPAPAEPIDPAESDRAAYETKEQRDVGRLDRARNFIAAHEYDAARTVLGAIEVSTWERDQLLATIPAGCRVEIELTADDCAALLKEARVFASGDLTKKLPAIGQVLILLIEAIKGCAMTQAHEKELR